VLLLSRLGAWVRLGRKNPAAVPADFREDAAGRGVEIVTGEHVPGHFAGADLVVLSPGSPRPPWLRIWVPARRPGLAELELASWFVDAPMVAVTGTNGKTTTVMLISHLLKSSGRSVFTGGNIGTPLSEYVLAGKPADVCVIEASSFQLQGVSTFRPKVAVLLNFSPNHLDWHADMEEYLSAKLKIFAMQGPSDLALVPEDLADMLAGRAFTKARIETFAPSDRFRCPRLLGRHNQADMEAAYAACRPFGVTEELAEQPGFDFVPAPHRRQAGGEARGGLCGRFQRPRRSRPCARPSRPSTGPCGFWPEGVQGRRPGRPGPASAPARQGGGTFRRKPGYLRGGLGAAPCRSPWSPTLAGAVETLYARAEPGDVILLSPAQPVSTSTPLQGPWPGFPVRLREPRGGPVSPEGEKR
jgi:UDP-N-acetylmuramoylalanine--D-glutamate ligase